MRSKVLVRIDRLLVKPVPVAVKMMPDAEMEPLYDGAKKMILVDDVDNRQFLCELVESMWEELPKKKEKDLNCGTQKACKLLDELEKAGVLERKRQGPGKPNKLYLKKVF